jgi:hypothetical protein
MEEGKKERREQWLHLRLGDFAETDHPISD